MDNPLLDIYRARLEHARRHDSRLWDQPNRDRCSECLIYGSLPGVAGGLYADEVGAPYEGDWHGLARYYSWAVPDEEALALITRYSPEGVVEVGAGAGYWAALLAARGVDVLAVDVAPPGSGIKNDWVLGEREPFHPVRQGGVEVVELAGHRTLFLCWPPMSSLATDALRAYRGRTVVYIGEGPGGCTADEEFFALLGEEIWRWDAEAEAGKAERRDSEWRRVEEYQIPQWWGLHDSLSIYQRPG